MATIRIDERTKEQMKTHRVLITATDKFLSGWGRAKNGLSKCAWACEKKNCDKVFEWVSNKSDMKYVNIHYDNWYPSAKHVHIYVVDENHPALK